MYTQLNPKVPKFLSRFGPNNFEKLKITLATHNEFTVMYLSKVCLKHALVYISTVLYFDTFDDIK